MRQFQYFYSSYIENKHGFLTFWPHANLLHPLFGIADIGYNPIDITQGSPYEPYAKYYGSTTQRFTHKIQIFFPEIREGFVYIDKIKYSVESNPIDDVRLDYKLHKNSKYYDYVQIKNHLATFEIEIIVDTAYGGVFHPIEVSCDYIDVLIHQQRISITETQSTVKIVPYISGHHTDRPMYYLNPSDKAITHMKSTNPTYQIILPKESGKFVERFGINLTEYLFRMTTLEPGIKLYVMTIEAYATNYALEITFDDINNTGILSGYSKENDYKYVPMINNLWFLGAYGTCKNGLQTYWTPIVYDQKWNGQDYPRAPCDPKHSASADDTRAYTWYYISKHITDSEAKLDELAEKNGIKGLIGDLYQDYLDSYYNKLRRTVTKAKDKK